MIMLVHASIRRTRQIIQALQQSSPINHYHASNHVLLSSYMRMFHHSRIDQATRLLRILKSSAIDHD